jgi:hypothetical protein
MLGVEMVWAGTEIFNLRSAIENPQFQAFRIFCDKNYA